MIQERPPPKQRIWLLTFEYAGIKKVGGLGEVAANQCRALSHDLDFELHVFMPSYNNHLLLQEKLHCSPITTPDGEPLVLRGQFDPVYFGVSSTSMIFSRTTTKYQTFSASDIFEIELWRGTFEGTAIYLLVGRNPLASRILNDPEVYTPDLLNAKMGLFSLALREFLRYCIHTAPDFLPDLIHIHDHHPVTAMLCCRQELNLNQRDIPTIITMHLLTWPRRELEFFWKAGVNNEPMRVQMGKNIQWLRMREIYTKCQENDDPRPSLEKIGCVCADRVVAVSENFKNSDIIPYCGGDLIRDKADFVWNGCDWQYDTIKQQVYNQVNSRTALPSSDACQWWDFRRAFLMKHMGIFGIDEPKIDSSEIRTVISQEFSAPPYHPDGKVDPFREDGPMVLITGRISPQKGVENIFQILPYIINVIPQVKFIFLMIPTEFAIDDLRNYLQVARQYPDNVRVILGSAGSIYFLAHLSADIYCCPSRWEPFGIVALEAMASRVPVVATYVGGLMESIVHVETDLDHGTGLLCPNNDQEALKHAIISLLSTMQIAEIASKKSKSPQPSITALRKHIVHPRLAARVRQDHSFGEQIRRQAFIRVDSLFRWSIVSQKLKQIYSSLLSDKSKKKQIVLLNQGV